MAPRLKVFVTSDGLTDFAVATSSRAKALAAWGIRQDVFKEGLAHETDDPELVAAATARPGEVMRRPARSRGELARLTAATRPAKPRGSSTSRRGWRGERALASLARERDELDRRTEMLEAEHAARRRKLETALSAARRALG